MASKPPAKKAAAKKAPAKKAPAKTAAPGELYTMPREVSDWIDRAQSIMGHQKGEIERLKKENAELRAYRKFAETRLLRSDHE